MSEPTLKEKIIQATLTELEAVEVSQISLRKIAKQLNVTAQAPYHYFPTKDALLMEIKIRALEGLNQRWKNINIEEPDLVKRMENLGLTYADYYYNNAGYYKVMKHRMKIDEQLKVEIKRARHTFISVAESIIDHYKIKSLSAEYLTLMCWSSIHGMIDLHLQSMISIDDLKPKDIPFSYIAKQLVNTISTLINNMAVAD